MDDTTMNQFYNMHDGCFELCHVLLAFIANRKVVDLWKIGINYQKLKT